MAGDNSMSDTTANYPHPPYTPITSLRRELGIMFGFLAACIVTVGVYYFFWQISQVRAAARDEARRKDLRARGFHHERGGYHDKALGRYASRDPAAQTQGQTLQFLTEPDQFTATETNLNNNNTTTTTNKNNYYNYNDYYNGNTSRRADIGLNPFEHDAFLRASAGGGVLRGAPKMGSASSFEAEEEEMQTFSVDGSMRGGLSAVHMHRARDIF